jgi:hypothetical protein
MMRTTYVKISSVILGAALIGQPAVSSAQDDVWVGRYSASWHQGAPGTDGEVLITRAPDAAASPRAKSEADRTRWTFSSTDKNKLIVLRRFLPDEYEGLTSTSPTECLSGDNIAICRIAPGSTVSFDGGGPVPEKFVARTGYYGILIRNGAAAFELTKLASEPWSKASSAKSGAEAYAVPVDAGRN